jgi:8-oxo-dGTP pyrophosphatase MutT (NUDIX family)
VTEPQATHPVWDGEQWVTVSVPMSGAEGVMIPVLRVVVVDDSGDRILLQRRDAGGETVRGLLEIPGGRWRSGESPIACAIREVFEETGIRLSAVDGVTIDAIDDNRSVASIRPLIVVAGVDGGFPAVHTVLMGTGSGTIVAETGASADVRWWAIADVFQEMSTNRSGFIPSSFAALSAYAEMLDSGI